MSTLMFSKLLHALLQTLYMVSFSSILAIIFGLILGILLFGSQKVQFFKQTALNRVLGVLTNITRSIPYIILMIALIPFTEWLIGTSIGINAAIIPLTLAAIPFYARISESAFHKVPEGLIEAALSMGASPLQIVKKVLLPESLPLLIQGGTLTVISLIGYSAMAGAVGAGGLGDLAMRFGYWRFNPATMLSTVVILVLLVQGVQMLGDYFAKQKHSMGLLVTSIVLVIFCSLFVFWPSAVIPQNTLKVGIIAGPQADVMQVAKKLAKRRYHLNIQAVEFEDYVLPNTALNSGDIDANIFQHLPFLQAQIDQRGYNLVPIARTFVYPMGLYSKKINQLSQLKTGAMVALPNDPSNEGRGLLLLQKAHLITLKKGVGLLGTVADITANPKNLSFKLLSAAQVAHSLQDVDLAAITNDFISLAHLTVSDALVKESAKAPYANIIVARKGNADNPKLKTLIKVMHSKEVLDEVHKIYPNGGAIAAWKSDH